MAFVEFGLWYDFRNPARWRRPYDELYREVLDQAQLAETLGFESIWVSEHHVTDEGYLPAMFPMLAALAMRTTSVRLGTAVLLAPFYHPIHFAEDAAVVDQLSGGRLELGVAPGYRVEEFAAFGIPHNERGSRTDELVEVARRAWTGRPFDYHGRHWSFDDVIVTPTPHQQPGPPVWIGGSTRAAARRAARLGCNYMPDAIAPPEVYRIYRDALVENGRNPENFRICTNRTIYVCDDPERGWEDVKHHYLWVYNRYREWFAAAGDNPDAGTPLADPDALSRELHLVGTPAQVIADIEALREERPFDRLMFWAHTPGLPAEKSSRSLELFARHVIPAFAGAGAGHEARA